MLRDMSRTVFWLVKDISNRNTETEKTQRVLSTVTQKKCFLSDRAKHSGAEVTNKRHKRGEVGKGQQWFLFWLEVHKAVCV